MPDRKKPLIKKPYKFSDRKKRKFLALVASGVTRKAAAKSVDIGRHVVYYHLERDAEFRELVYAADMEAVDTGENALKWLAFGNPNPVDKDGNRLDPVLPHFQALRFFLINRHPSAWKSIEKVIHEGEIEVTNYDGGSVLDKLKRVAERKAEIGKDGDRDKGQ